jgi:uncharacterized protein YjbI with pentapeptide repeats
MARRQRTQTAAPSAARSDKPVEPRMPAHRETAELGSIGDGVWTESTLTGTLPPDHEGRMVLMEVHLRPASMVGALVAESRLIDVLVDGADLAGARFEGSSLTRVEVRDARLSGARFDQARLRDVRFVRCVLDDANFAMAQGERVRFEDCRMIGARFSDATLDGVAWWDCDLTDADFSQVHVSRAQLQGSTIDGLQGAASLVPVAIDRHQFVAFGQHLLDTLGVTVQERTG